MIPTGKTSGAIIFLATVSDASKSKPPSMHEKGSNSISFPPITLRTICGTTRPTNPMIPTRDTIRADTNDAPTMALYMQVLLPLYKIPLYCYGG